MSESVHKIRDNILKRKLISKIANSNYGLWTVIAQKSVESQQEQVFLSLLLDFISSNRTAADEVFGEELMKEIIELR